MARAGVALPGLGVTFLSPMRRVFVTTTLPCPDCGADLRVKPGHELQGRSLRCAACGARWEVLAVAHRAGAWRVDLLAPVDEGGRWIERLWVQAA